MKPFMPLSVLASFALIHQARPDVVTLNPSADALIAASQPANNDGGARSLAIAAPGLPGDLAGANPVGLRLYPIGATIACLVNSRSFGVIANRPELSITAVLSAPPCYANCDASTALPILNVNDFSCFLNRFAAGCS